MVARLTGDLLPPCVQAWLTAMETHQLTVPSVGGKAPAKPDLTAQDQQTVSDCLKSHSDTLAPAKSRGPELEFVVGKLFTAFNVYTGDEAKLKMQVMVCAKSLNDIPYSQSGWRIAGQ